ncbi:MAG: hypothetical protein H8E36_01940 [Rhodospirillaceae bacterium]|nr:hypothetical protein [Rhodospirillaceae bacterium]MBL6940908.1 hypothetical protein [Rhodospirillales bacterium]
MPKELRKLVFDDAELRAAAYDYCLRNSVNIPQAPVDEILVSDNDASVLVLRFSSGDSNDPKEVPLSRDQVGAALIKFCSANKIPLPRVAQKILKVDGQEVSMMVSVQWATKPKID